VYFRGNQLDKNRSIFFLFCISLFMLCFTGGYAQTGSALQSMNASPIGSDIQIRWELTSAQGVTSFKLFRKIGTENSFAQITEMQATGDIAYSFIDKTLFRDNAKFITYRLRIYKGVTFTEHDTFITFSPTSVQSTWGSIKAMFR